MVLFPDLPGFLTIMICYLHGVCGITLVWIVAGLPMRMRNTLHNSVIYYFITDAYIPSSEAVPRKRMSYQHLESAGLVCRDTRSQQSHVECRHVLVQ
jgi:hypothetical protein